MQTKVPLIFLQYESFFRLATERVVVFVQEIKLQNQICKTD